MPGGMAVSKSFKNLVPPPHLPGKKKEFHLEFVKFTLLTVPLWFSSQKAEGNKKEITVLDPKRSNAINIGLTVLPPPRTIKMAIIKMDSAIMNREGIEVSGCFFRFHLDALAKFRMHRRAF